MIRKPKVQRRRVKALTDPQPEFVSLVTAGANMTPFKAMKADEAPAADPAPAVAAPEVTDESVEVVKADTHEIVKVVFQKSEFAEVDAVKAWLADGGYENYGEIAEDDTTFTVGEEREGATKMEYTGVTVFAVQRPVEEDETVADPNAESSPTAVTDVQPVAKSEAEASAGPGSVSVSAAADPAAAPTDVAAEVVTEERKRYDDFMAMFSEGTSLEKVLADGYDGLPPAIHEVTNAMYVAVRNSALARDMGSIKAASAAYGDMVVKLCELFPSGAQSEAAKAALAGDAPALQADAPTEKADEPAPVVEEPVVEVVAETVVEETAAKQDETVTESAPAADLTALITSLATSVQELTANVRDLHNQVAVKSEELTERVSAIESERQSRKGADVDDVQAESHSTKQKSGLSDLRLRGALGMRRPTP